MRADRCRLNGGNSRVNCGGQVGDRHWGKQNATSWAVYPALKADERECWYVNMGIVTKGFLEPTVMERAGHWCLSARSIKKRERLGDAF